MDDCLTDTIQLFLKSWRHLHGNEAMLEIIFKMEKMINKDGAKCVRGTEDAGIHGEHNYRELWLTSASLFSFCTHCNSFREAFMFYLTFTFAQDFVQCAKCHLARS